MELTMPDVSHTESSEFPDEITHIGVVQVGGLTGQVMGADGEPVESVRCSGFPSYTEAVFEVRGIVEAAHGEVALLINSIAKFTYDLGGDPRTESVHITKIVSPGGPTHGYVIEVTH
jgi:hypothetical protein